MKYILSFAFVNCLLFGSTFAQMFDWKTNDSLKVENIEVSMYLSLYMVNNTGDSLILDWENIENTFPTEWEVTLCDYTTCYIGVPQNGSMTTLQNGEEGFFSLTIATNAHPGSGIIRFYTYNKVNPNDGDTATFIVNSTYTGINSRQSKELTLEVFPNPSSNFISIKNLPDNTREIWISTLDGKIVKHQESRMSQGIMDVSDLSKGLYIINVRDVLNSVHSSRFIKN